MLKSIDNWDEFLDRPKVPGIVRSPGNWQARLAAAALNVQLGHPILVLPQPQNADGKTSKKPQFCWACAFAHFKTTKKQRRGHGQRGIDDNAFRAEDVPFMIA
jgi:hypothetical protein